MHAMVLRQSVKFLLLAYALCGFTPGKEFEEFKSLTQMLPMGFGDDMLRFNGLGERITWEMNNNNRPNDQVKQRYFEIADTRRARL